MRKILDILILILILPAIGLASLLSDRAKQSMFDRVMYALEIATESLTDEEWEEILSNAEYNPNHMFDTPEQTS